MATISDRTIGKGPVATVYIGHHRGVEVAVKVYPRRFDRPTLTATERTVAALAKLDQPILPVDGIEVIDGRHAIRMPLCASSLAELVQKAPLGVEYVTTLGRDMAHALAAAHAAGVVHGGVTPHNILFTQTGTPVLADFGVALRDAFPGGPGDAVEFQSPETLQRRELTEQTDVYGLGAVLHYALTGSSPHPSRLGEPPQETALRVLREAVPAINHPDVPIGLSTVIARMLAPDPAHRVDAATAAARLTAMAPKPVPPPPPPSPPKPARRWYHLAAVALVLAGVGAFLLLRPDPPASNPPPPPPVPVRVDLAVPVDGGDHVDLTWTGPANLAYAVVVTPEGDAPQTLLADNKSAMTVPVRPNRKYCFLVRATDGPAIYVSRPQPLHGATC